MNSPLNSYVSGSENKAEDFTGPMNSYFKSVEKNTTDYINSKKKKETRNKVYKDAFAEKLKEVESDDSWESGGGKDYESGLAEKKLFKFDSIYFQDL